MNNLYSIVDLDGYASEMRKAAADSLAEKHEENLDEYISIKQVYNIISKESVATDDSGRYILDKESNEKIFDTIAVWIYNVGLAKLAANDLVECAWDDKSNEMIFWINETKTKNKIHNDESKHTKNKRKNR
jgi:GH24 family phage-related lysozyme (muramidase)